MPKCTIHRLHTHGCMDIYTKPIYSLRYTPHPSLLAAHMHITILKHTKLCCLWTTILLETQNDRINQCHNPYHKPSKHIFLNSNDNGFTYFSQVKFSTSKSVPSFLPNILIQTFNQKGYKVYAQTTSAHCYFNHCTWSWPWYDANIFYFQGLL